MAARSGPSQRAATLDPPLIVVKLGMRGAGGARRHRICDRRTGGSQAARILISPPGSVVPAGPSQSAGEPNEADAINSSNEGIFADIFETLTLVECRSAVTQYDPRAGPAAGNSSPGFETASDRGGAPMYSHGPWPVPSRRAGQFRFDRAQCSAVKGLRRVNPALLHSFLAHPR